MAIVLGTFLDGVPESAVGLTLLQSGEIGVTMLVAVFISNLPESIAIFSGLRASGWEWNSVMILWSVIAVAGAASAALGYAVLDGASPSTLGSRSRWQPARSSRCSPIR